MSFYLTLPLDAKGVNIPVYATLIGHPKVPFWASIPNSLYPRLRFFEDRVEFRVLLAQRRAWSEVESVDAWFSWKKPQLTLNFRDTPWNFTATVVLPRTLRETLEFLDSKGPILSARARQFLETPL